MKKKLSFSKSDNLEVEFSDSEVWDALCSCDGNKALGIDGLNLQFIKKNCLLNKVIELDMVRGINFGSGMVHVLHLQFTDDMGLFIKPRVDYLRNLRRILRCFELAPGLRVNFYKSGVVKDMVCLSKKKGGLGIGRIPDKNKALLSKWIWRFGGEEGTLWRKMVCAKYGYDASGLWWVWKVPNSASIFVNVVRGLLVEGSMSTKIIMKGMCVVLENGKKIRLWEDLRCNSKLLREAFPRIFTLLVKKFGAVQEFRKWFNEKWAWEVSLKREIFD
ncbi:hypothetical protein Ddye_016813 [Dipteronia dyeriana]|uniref:Uncharacterized protein n=1 Tax=Dipteronia dyeriana TaxID=168575 RepID=A0AAD9U8D5_9ROSI|nr:hypothetical protein Ddye_016813 [Dipteronia dyeriana]